MNTNTTRLATRLLHSGRSREWQARTRAVPLYQTGSYIFESAERAAKAFALEVPDHLYGRISNPTTEVLEAVVAALDGGTAAVGFASGMAAVSATLLNNCQQGDRLVSSTSLYGGTRVLFDYELRKLGIETAFVEPSDLHALEREVARPRVKAFFCESIGNPRNDIADFDEIGRICRRHDVPFIVDNSLTPGLLRPKDHGIDVVVYSLSKYLSGHGLVIGGMAVELTPERWSREKFPAFFEPDPTYGGLIFGRRENPFSLRLRAHQLKDFGASLSPMNAFLTLIGVETLALRMERVCRTASVLAQRLLDSGLVAWVNYPGVGVGESARAGLRYFGGKGGGIVCFGLGTSERSQRLADRLRLVVHMANMGDTRTLIQHCASTSHAQLDAAQLASTGTLPDLLRLSVGLEDVEDLWDDLHSALRAT